MVLVVPFVLGGYSKKNNKIIVIIIKLKESQIFDALFLFIYLFLKLKGAQR